MDPEAGGAPRALFAFVYFEVPRILVYGAYACETAYFSSTLTPDISVLSVNHPMKHKYLKVELTRKKIRTRERLSGNKEPAKQQDRFA